MTDQRFIDESNGSVLTGVNARRAEPMTCNQLDGRNEGETRSTRTPQEKPAGFTVVRQSDLTDLRADLQEARATSERWQRRAEQLEAERDLIRNVVNGRVR